MSPLSEIQHCIQCAFVAKSLWHQLDICFSNLLKAMIVLMMKMSKQVYYIMTKNEKKLFLIIPCLCVASWISKILTWICSWILDLVFFIKHSVIRQYDPLQVISNFPNVLQILTLMKVFDWLARWYKTFLYWGRGEVTLILLLSMKFQSRTSLYRQCR